jgi:hypothetical protein
VGAGRRRRRAPWPSIEALLEHGAALDPTANGTHSAMMVAVENGNLPPAADLLLRARLPSWAVPARS